MVSCPECCGDLILVEEKYGVGTFECLECGIMYMVVLDDED